MTTNPGSKLGRIELTNRRIIILRGFETKFVFVIVNENCNTDRVVSKMRVVCNSHTLS